MATASADAPTFFVVRVAISHFLCRPVWSTYDNVLRLSHRVVPTCVEPVIFALDSLLVSIEPCEKANALVPPASVEQASSARRRNIFYFVPGTRLGRAAAAGRVGDASGPEVVRALFFQIEICGDPRGRKRIIATLQYSTQCGGHATSTTRDRPQRQALGLNERSLAKVCNSGAELEVGNSGIQYAWPVGHGMPTRL